MRDISARELKGHNILAVERFRDNTRWMVEFFGPASPAPPTAAPAMRCGCFSPRTAIRPALDAASSSREIKIKRCAHVD